MNEDTLGLEGCTLGMLDERDARELAATLAAMEPWTTLRSSADGLEDYLTRPDLALERRSVRVEGELAGVLCVRHPWLRGPFVELLALFRSRQRRGLGRRVLDWVENRPEWGRDNVWVTVSAFNTGARAFYGRCGFDEVAWLPGLVSAGRDEILLRKRLVEESERR